MPVAGDQAKFPTPGYGGNPDIVFRNWLAQCSEFLLDFTILTGYFEIAQQYRVLFSELLDPDLVLFGPGRLGGTEEKFTDCDDRDQYFACIPYPGDNYFIPI